MHQYLAFNIKVYSELLLPELGAPTEFHSGARKIKDEGVGKRHDRGYLAIRFGTVPAKLDRPHEKGVLFEVCPDHVLYKIPGVASYLVRNGNEIVIDAASDGSVLDVRTFLLGACLGALLHQRGILTLNASAIDIPEFGAVVFAGVSGVGKSSLLAGMLKRGYRMLADDACAIEWNDDRSAVVVPAFPSMRLWEDSILSLGWSAGKLERVREGLSRYRISTVDSFEVSSQPLRHIYLLVPDHIDEVGFEAVSGARAVDAILVQTYRKEILAGMGEGKGHFQRVLSVARQVPITRIRRPHTALEIDDFVKAVDSHLKTCGLRRSCSG